MSQNAKGILYVIIIIVVVALLIFAVAKTNNSGTPDENINMDEQKTNPTLTLKTNKGDIVVEIFESQSPITAGNFLELSQKGFYDGVKFHRVIDGFMIQGGDPLTKDDSQVARWGTGGPGYAIDDEFIEGLSNVRGTLAMANSGPNSGGSQFFINVADNLNLDWDKNFNPPGYPESKHPVFGKVTAGMDVVDAIAKSSTDGNDRPVEAVVIESVTIK